MEKYVEIRKFHEHYSEIARCNFVFCITFIIVFVFGILINYQSKDENLISFNGVVTSQTYDNENDNTDFYLENYEIDFWVNGKFEENLEGKKVEFITFGTKK